MFAIGRDPCTQGIGLEEVGVSLNPKYVHFQSLFLYVMFKKQAAVFYRGPSQVFLDPIKHVVRIF